MTQRGQLRFGDCELDLDAFELRRGGQTVPIEPQVLELLNYLAANPGRLVTKDELIAHVWNGRIVSDAALASRIKSARRAIGDDGAQQRLIRTVHGRGWRFMEFRAAAERKALSAVPADKTALAVLPLRYLGDEPDRGHVLDGLVEDIAGALSRFAELRVTSPGSTLTYKDRAMPPSQIGRELGVEYLIEGSARISGRRLRLAVGLVDAFDQTLLWSESYEHDLDNVFAMLDAISQRVAGSVAPALSLVEATRSANCNAATLTARDLYYRGLAQLYTFSEAGLDAARQFFTEAISATEDFGAAHARLAYVHVQKFWYGSHDARPIHVDAAIACASRAISIDDGDAFAHFALGRALALKADYVGAATELERAIDLNPSLAQAHFGLGQALFYANRSGEGLPCLRMAIQLSPRDPHAWTFHHVKALAHFDLNQLEEAEAEAIISTHRARATHWSYATLVAILGARGKKNEAVGPLAELHRLKPNYTCEFARAEFEGYKRGEFVDRYVAGLRAAGLPSEARA